MKRITVLLCVLFNGYFCKDVFDTSKVINPDTNNNYVNRNYDNDIQYLVVYHE